jgi:hypothetical protein
MACSNETWPVNPASVKFDFTELNDIAQEIASSCPSDSRLSSKVAGALSKHGCLLLTGEPDSVFKGWTAYSGSDIYTRLATWKLPLLQLLFLFQRPPLGFSVSLFAMLHLIGDPIDTMASLMHTLSRCQEYAKIFQEYCDTLPNHLVGSHHKPWKAFTLVAVSFDECGDGDAALHIMDQQ